MYYMLIGKTDGSVSVLTNSINKRGQSFGALNYLAKCDSHDQKNASSGILGSSLATSCLKSIRFIKHNS